MRRSARKGFTTTGLHAVLPCRAAVVLPDPHFPGRDHRPPPAGGRVAVAEAEPRQAGPARAGLPAHGAGTGLRQGEAFGLALNRIDAAVGVITVDQQVIIVGPPPGPRAAEDLRVAARGANAPVCPGRGDEARRPVGSVWG